jgi:hypothetical protein
MDWNDLSNEEFTHMVMTVPPHAEPWEEVQPNVCRRLVYRPGIEPRSTITGDVQVALHRDKTWHISLFRLANLAEGMPNHRSYKTYEEAQQAVDQALTKAGCRCL